MCILTREIPAECFEKLVKYYVHLKCRRNLKTAAFSSEVEVVDVVSYELLVYIDVVFTASLYLREISMYMINQMNMYLVFRILSLL